MTIEQMIKKIRCPECLGDVEVPEDVIVGEVLECLDCGAELEVYEINGNEVKVRVAEMGGEDWGE